LILQVMELIKEVLLMIRKVELVKLRSGEAWFGEVLPTTRQRLVNVWSTSAPRLVNVCSTEDGRTAGKIVQGKPDVFR
jgi:hypothetical protein